jgi:hypothetical protein
MAIPGRQWRMCSRAFGCLAVWIAFALTGLPGTAANAQDWVPELQQPAAGTFFAADEVIVIVVPDEVMAGGAVQLAVELDEFDVTAVIQQEGERLLLDPPLPLEPGEHRLRLVEYGADGSILERGSWTFEVRDGATRREISASANNAVDFLYRFAGNDLIDPPDNFTAQGAGDAQARVADQDWSFDANANYFLNSQQDQTVDGRRFDVGEYLFSGNYTTGPTDMNLSLGHQDIGADNLIMSDFYRRGLSVTLAQPDENLSVTAFALRSEPTLGASNFTGVADQENRVQGVSLSARPIESLSENVEVTGTFYQGETRAVGSSNGIISEDSSGTGGALALDTHWLEQRLRLRGEVALTRFDFDDDGDLPADNDLAYDLLASYALIPGGDVDGRYVSWDMGVQHKRVGTFFATIANPFVVSDRETTSAFTNATIGEVSLQAQAGYETSNVEELNALPTDRVLFATFNGSYTPVMEPDAEGNYGWLGQPTFGLSLNFNDGKQIDIPAGFLALGGDYQVRSATVSVATFYETWGWNASQTLNSFEDRTGTTGDTVNYLTDLGLQFQPAPELSINPYAQLSIFRDDASTQDLDSVNLGVDIAADLIPEVLTATLNTSLNLTESIDHTPDTYFVGGEVLWNAIPAKVNRPGVALGVTGSYLHTDDADFFIADDVLQVFGKVKLTMPLAY